MHTVIKDLSSLQKEKIVLAMRTSTTSALRFSLSYHIQPPGYYNGVGEVEVVAEHPSTHERATHATLTPNDAVILGLEKVLRYFQYAKAHLSTQKSAPLTYEKWSKSLTI